MTTAIDDPMAGAPPSRVITSDTATEKRWKKREKRFVLLNDGLDQPGWDYRNFERPDGTVTRYVTGRAEPVPFQLAAE